MHTFADPLQRAKLLAKNRVGVIDGDQQFTFGELADRCARLAAGLRALGCEQGDRVAILANNGHEYIETYVGVPASGLVVVPLNTRHAEPELRYALEDAGAKVLIADRDVSAISGSVETVLDMQAYEELVQGAEPMALGEGVAENDLAGLFYTGGTTGKSKGVMLSHRNLISNTFHWLMTVPHEPEDMELVIAPLFHAAGSNGVLGAIWKTTPQVTLAAFDPKQTLDLIEKHRATHTLGVPAMLSGIAEEQHSNPRDVSSMRYISHGGSPIATEVVRRVATAMPQTEVVEVYGATELSPLTTVLRHEEQLLDDPRGRSCGPPVPGNDIRILAPDGKELPTGEIGEVTTRGPNVMQGYWNKPEQTEAVLKGGAYWTGDLGYMDDEGFLYLVDRSKDMIVSGGENVYCTEVEEVLYTHPAVLEAAAFGVPDDKWGEAVHAVVVPRAEHANVDPAEIIEHCRAQIAGYKVPKGIDIQQEPLPKSGPGKVLKRELRAPFWDGKERGVN
ncbi:MAG: class I adenylate-forming enzyme family protein [Pseudomonadales bacterium]